MEPKLQRRVQRYGWDKAAEHYERYWSRQIEPAQDRLLAAAALRPGDAVVDIACGTGLVTMRAADAVGSRGRVVGTDISQVMVEAVAAQAAARGLTQANFRRMGAEQLKLPDGEFDVALDALGLMYVPDPLQALREMHRVLKPGGRAVACVWGARGRCGWAEIFPIVDCRVSTDVCPLFFQLGTGSTLADRFHDAQFRDVKTERVRTKMHYANAAEALGAAFVGGPVAMAYARFDDATRETAHNEYLRSIEAHRDGDGYNVPGEFVIVSGGTMPE